MNRVLLSLILGSTLLVIGCSKKSSNNPVSVINDPPPAKSVTFTMHLESGTQGMIFVATPSEDVTIAKVDISFPAQGFAETVENPNPTAVIAKNSNIQIQEYVGVDAGQKWVLTFYGTIASTGKSFKITVNWDVV